MSGIAAIGGKSKAYKSCFEDLSVPINRFGMKPLLPEPPIWADRPLQEAGRTTRKLMGFAFSSFETGAMEPFTLQYPRVDPAAFNHIGAFRVTADTGSPMAETGIELPSFSAVHSASVMTMSSPGVSCVRLHAA